MTSQSPRGTTASAIPPCHVLLGGHVFPGTAPLHLLCPTHAQQHLGAHIACRQLQCGCCSLPLCLASAAPTRPVGSARELARLHRCARHLPVLVCAQTWTPHVQPERPTGAPGSEHPLPAPAFGIGPGAACTSGLPHGRERRQVMNRPAARSRRSSGPYRRRRPPCCVTHPFVQWGARTARPAAFRRRRPLSACFHQPAAGVSFMLTLRQWPGCAVVWVGNRPRAACRSRR